MVLGVRELDQSGISEGDRNWSNLHTVYTHGNGVIAAFANQRGPDNSPGAGGDPVRRGAAGRRGPAPVAVPRRLREPRLLRRGQPRLLDRRQDRRARADVELDLGAAGGNTEDTNLTTYDGEGGVPVDSFLDQVLYAVQVRRPQLRALRAGQRQQQGALHRAAGRARGEGRAVADARPGPLPGGGRRPDRVDPRRLHHDRPVPAGAARVVRGHDRRLARRGQPVRHAAHRRDQLHAQRGQGDRRRLRRHRDALRVGRDRPDPPGLAQRLPRHGEGQARRSPRA